MTTPDHDHTTTSRKSLRYLAGAALVTGGVMAGALFAPIGLAGAEVADDSTATTADAATEDGERERGDRSGRKGNRLERIAEVSGLSVEQLSAGYEADQSLAEIAEANGVDVDALAADLEAAMTERIESKVEEGRLTQEEADAKIAELGDKVDQRLNLTPSERSELRAERKAERQAERDAEGADDADEADEAATEDEEETLGS